MSDWQPLSVRVGKRPRRTAVEGIPDGAGYPLRYWAEGMFGYRRPANETDASLEIEVAAVVGIELQRTYETAWEMQQILEACEADDDVFLDVLDAILFARPRQNVKALDRILTTTGSIWGVNEAGKGLIRRVDPTAEQQFRVAVSPEDATSGELRDAWVLAYGREPNPSDAWDHAIKAVEDILIPIVVPNQTEATLGHVIGTLKSNPQKFQVLLGGVQELLALLALIWPNPDRHGGGADKRTPAPEEAEAAVQTAVLLVQWGRRGFLTSK